MAHRMRETFTLMDRRMSAFCRRFSHRVTATPRRFRRIPARRAAMAARRRGGAIYCTTAARGTPRFTAAFVVQRHRSWRGAVGVFVTATQPLPPRLLELSCHQHGRKTLPECGGRPLKPHGGEGDADRTTNRGPSRAGRLCVTHQAGGVREGSHHFVVSSLSFPLRTACLYSSRFGILFP